MQKKHSVYKLAAFFSVYFVCCSGNGNENRKYPYPNASLVNTTRGKEIFEQRCIMCHGLHGNYRDINAADLTLSKLDSPGIVATIKNGRGLMPMFDNVFADSDLANLEQYVMTLRK